MIKTFYKSRPPKKVFFNREIKLRSFAYGKEVHNEFLEWRKSFYARWNKLNSNFLLLERGEIGANPVKVGTSDRIMVAKPKNQREVNRKSGSLAPLWVEDMYLEATRDGDLFINDEKSEIVLGSELKAWGVTAVWESTLPTYTMFIVGKDKHGEVALRAYPFDIKSGPIMQEKASVKLNATINKRSYLYCFGKHIFLVHESTLYYYYYNTDLGRLEEVAIKTDEPNKDKDFCNNVTGALVCDGAGGIHWQSGNSVFSFTIGYPGRLNCIELGDRHELCGIQCFGEDLYVYRKNKISKEYSCLQYTKIRGEYEGKVFNHGAKSNLFYMEKGGFLYYLKIPALSRRASVIRNSAGNESVLSDIEMSASQDMFCVNGNLYLDCKYVGS